MYQYIYFDLDNTLVWDNPQTGKSEIVKSGYEKYIKLRKEHSASQFILFTNRLRKEISYPSIFHFDEIVGKDDMDLFIVENRRKVPFTKYFNPKNLVVFFTALHLFTSNQTPKLLYLFVRHTSKGEKVGVEDDDRRVSRLFQI